jgi:ABC-2 type transport system ATP-binding protein
MPELTVTAILEVKNLTKRYKAHQALKELTLSIQAGEIFALLGPNGAGKTTLIGAVCGLLRKTSGSIRLFGIDLDVDPVGPRYSVGLVPQEINFDPFFSVRECLEIQLGFYGKQIDRARIDEVLVALSLSEKAEVATRALSGGMKRRLLIAKALVHRPKLVFLDEPTAGVDVELRRDLWSYVQKLKGEGTTVVLTTHYLEEAEALADRVGIIDKGELLLVEEKQALLSRLGERRLEVKFKSSLGDVLLEHGTLSADRQSLTFVERHDGPRATQVLETLFERRLPIADVAMHPASLEDVMLRVLESKREETKEAAP